ncbi:YolD-like family protein [Metabacillus halosaccharovorans]|uniref:YolD-like family protein n=1 Tax=Metabacillus halosaccharovorans TaxID=930124 RepID=UPI001C1F827B|nr:YolD-like family protein [Metabacillus halosaccharovorans]MBU7595932.1 YolD-like family protein [Metabacillus halosaccharovorans]
MLKDRSLKKWAPFIMPEHKGLINSAFKESEKVKKPILDDYQIQEINTILVCSIQDQIEVKLTLWFDGFFEEIQPVLITKIDPYTRRLYVLYKDNHQHFSFDALVDVSPL